MIFPCVNGGHLVFLQFKGLSENPVWKAYFYGYSRNISICISGLYAFQIILFTSITCRPSYFISGVVEGNIYHVVILSLIL